MGNLQTYEIEILSDHNKKEKNITFVVQEQDPESDPDETSDDLVVLLTKQFFKFLKQVKQKNNSRGGKFQNQKGPSSSSSKNTSKQGLQTTIKARLLVPPSQKKNLIAKGFATTNVKDMGM